jgi:hypothetical protein
VLATPLLMSPILLEIFVRYSFLKITQIYVTWTGKQCCGPGLIDSVSGSRILDEYRSGSGYGSIVLMTKN